jgi:hypothetical protein
MDMTFWLEYFTNALKTQMLEVKSRGESAIKKDIIIERASKENLNERQRSVELAIKEIALASLEKVFGGDAILNPVNVLHERPG